MNVPEDFHVLTESPPAWEWNSDPIDADEDDLLGLSIRYGKHADLGWCVSLAFDFEGEKFRRMPFLETEAEARGRAVALARAIVACWTEAD